MVVTRLKYIAARIAGCLRKNLVALDSDNDNP